jgi:rfaE bifunctional protein nucleotidyltransferase chain/domain
MTITTSDELQELVESLRGAQQRIVFTNGVFDILHAGHTTYLDAARALGDVLIVGLNADASVKRLKGPDRPINTESDRATVLVALRSVDHVVIFEQDTPLELITEIVPDVLVKGGDYTRQTIVGADVVEQHGGHVVTIPLVEGRSTTNVINRARTV